MSAAPAYVGISASSSTVYPPSPSEMNHSSAPQYPIPSPLLPPPAAGGGANMVQYDPNAASDDEDDDEDGTPSRPKKKVKGDAKDEEGGEGVEREKGRRKIEIAYIEKKEKRHITFSKRKAGIMKKAYELATLTGTQVLLLVVSETGIVYTFTTAKFQPLVGAGEGGLPSEGQRLIQQCLAVDPDENSDYISPPPDGPLLPLPPSAAKRPFETNSAIHGGQISLRTRTHKPSARAKQRPANIRTPSNNPVQPPPNPSPLSSGSRSANSHHSSHSHSSGPHSAGLSSGQLTGPLSGSLSGALSLPPTPGIHLALDSVGGPGPGPGAPLSAGIGGTPLPLQQIPPSPHRLQGHHPHSRMMQHSPTNRDYPASPGLSGGGPHMRSNESMQNAQDYARMMQQQGGGAYGAPPLSGGRDPYGVDAGYRYASAEDGRQPHMDQAQLQQRIHEAQQMEQHQRQQQHYAQGEEHRMGGGGGGGGGGAYMHQQQHYPEDQYMMGQGGMR